MAERSDKGHPNPPNTAPDLVPSLSAREIEIARHYALGKTSKEVAKELFISQTTVRNHVAAIYQKLNIRNKTELVNLLGSSGNKETVKEPESVSEPAQERPDKPSIAVLPFTNMSGDPEQEYFSDGITEDIITGLSRFRDLFVIARNSAFVFKSQSVNVNEVANKLGVQYIVEGSVRKIGKRIRITAQLVNAETGNQTWAEHYDRDLKEIFEVQDDVTQAISTTLMGRVEQAGKDRVKRKIREDLNAYDYLLQGREHFFKMTPDANTRAKEMFEKAISIDAEYAAAYAGLADACLSEWVAGWSDKLDVSLSLGWDYAMKSISLDDSDSRAHTVYGAACYWRREFDEAEFHLERALALNPGDTRALVHMARYQFLAGNPERGVLFATEASNINPFGKIGYYLGQAYYAARRYPEAIRALKTVHDPIALIYAWLAASYAQSGQQTMATEAAEKFVTMARTEIFVSKTLTGWVEFFSQRWPFKNREDLTHVLNGLRQAGLE